MGDELTAPFESLNFDAFPADKIEMQLENLRDAMMQKPKNVHLRENELASLEIFLESSKSQIQKIRTARKEEAEARERQRRIEEERARAAMAAQAEEARRRQQEQMFDSPHSPMTTFSADDQQSTIGSESDGDPLEASPNTPSVDFLSFIEADGAYLMLEKKIMPPQLHAALQKDRLTYPLGVTHDEDSKLWIICDRNVSKILVFNMNTELMTTCDGIKSPTAVVVFKNGCSVAVLSCDDRFRHEIFIYHYNTDEPFLQSYATYKKPIYDIKSQLRGLAKSVAGNLLSIENSSKSKRLRVFNKEKGGKGFEIQGAQSPSFIATYRSTVAVSDLGCNKVFIINLEDHDWNNMSYSVIHTIISEPISQLDQLANQSGFLFVSGMQFDLNGYLLIGDAKGHSIKLYDTSYQFLHRVSSDIVLPYVSSFHINRNGECILLDVQSNPKYNFVKLTSIPEILPWIPPTGRGVGAGATARRPQQKF